MIGLNSIDIGTYVQSFCHAFSVVITLFFFFLMIRRPPRSTRTDTLFPYTTLFRSGSYELHSLATDGRIRGDATPYLTAAGERPPSETVGESVLDILGRSEEHTSELQSLMRISYAVFCLKKKKKP